MNPKILRECATAYHAVYNQNIREELEEQKDFENWVNSLIDEGYDLSEYTWEEVYEAYVEEAKKDEDEKEYSGYGKSSKFTQDTDRKSFKPGVDVPPVKKFGRISRAIPHGIGAHANRTASRVTTITGGDPGAPRSEKMPEGGKKPKLSKEIIRHPKTQKEQVDIYDIILSHLLDEGYASNVESAEKIMVNMSEEWIASILG